MRTHLAAAGVHVQYGARVTGLEQEAESVEVTVEREGVKTTITSPWVVGCDGARSAVRELADFKRKHRPMDRWLYLADVKLSGDVPPITHGEIHLTPGEFLLMLPLNRDGWWRAAATGPKAVTGAPRPMPTAADIGAALASRFPHAVTIQDTAWVSSFRVHEHVVDSYRRGRVFLAGDAAHAHSPAGGRGANTGVQDAVALGWRLAAVVKGQAGDVLLDSYSAERRPVAALQVKGTGGLTGLVTAKAPLLRWLRRTLLMAVLGRPAIRRHLTLTAMMLTVSYRRTKGAAVGGASGGAVRPGDRAPLGVPGLAEARDRPEPVLLLLGAGAGAAAAEAEAMGLPFHVVRVVSGKSGGQAGAAESGAATATATTTTSTTTTTTPPTTTTTPTLADGTGALAAAFGAGDGAVLVRPDGYVGWARAGPGLDGLQAWWAGLVAK